MSNQLVGIAATAQLLDGRFVSLRPLGAEDAEATVALHQHLSDYDRYFRFFTLNQINLNELVGKMTEPAQGHCAVGAFDADRLIGVANYVVVHDDPKAAEIAVAVAHEDHSLGVGTALLRHLAQLARARGVERFVADVLGENQLMLTVFFDLGWPCKSKGCGSVRHLEIELPDRLDETPTAANAIA
ncbi:GNAT family N-acetyltransferase [Mycobacterium numidiamassiliense]|uniref:GNAT family N-acetyltransferase n=1 Tax=Mycobacterium numidiamassiliense TaxID=1841861 RepID=UPI00097DF0B8|nr:GNAT family N-acetyltransferase [Mycobacterium numidiamassiliense]